MASLPKVPKTAITIISFSYITGKGGRVDGTITYYL
jgi:hypothetical protein